MDQNFRFQIPSEVHYFLGWWFWIIKKKILEKFSCEFRWMESSHLLQRGVFALLLLLQCFLRMKGINTICTYLCNYSHEEILWMRAVQHEQLRNWLFYQEAWYVKVQIWTSHYTVNHWLFFFLNFKALYLQIDMWNF